MSDAPAGWQPISTAPPDTSRVLVGYWTHNGWSMYVARRDSNKRMGWRMVGNQYPSRPQYWMPIAEPPKPPAMWWDQPCTCAETSK